MTAVAKISLPLAAVALVAALLVPLMAPLGAAPSINVSLPAAQTSTLDWEVEDYAMDVRHTDKSHFPNHPGTRANTMVAVLIATWSELLTANQGPDPQDSLRSDPGRGRDALSRRHLGG